MKSAPIFKVVSTVFGIGLVIWMGVGFIAERNIESPNYIVTHKDGPFEIRQYAPMLIAETTIHGDYRQALNDGVRRLAGYIFGKNVSTKKIPKTAPVLHSTTSERIPMTAPVLTKRSKGAYQMAVVLPSSYTKVTLPKPVDKRVSIKPLHLHEVAVYRFSGFNSEEKIERKVHKLSDKIKRLKRQPEGEVLVAQYNAPWVFPLFRRNEVLVQLK